MAWFKKEKTPKQPQVERRLKMPEGLWVKCEACKEMVYKKEVLRNANVCPKCNYHFRIDARERLKMLLDDGAFEEFDADMVEAISDFAGRQAAYEASLRATAEIFQLSLLNYL